MHRNRSEIPNALSDSESMVASMLASSVSASAISFADYNFTHNAHKQRLDRTTVLTSDVSSSQSRFAAKFND